MKPQRKRTHIVLSGDRSGHVQMLPAADARPIHRPGRFRVWYTQTPICQCGAAPSCWKMNSSSSVCCWIYQFLQHFQVHLSHYSLLRKEEQAEYMPLETAQITFTLGMSLSISSTATGFLDPHIQILCLWSFPDNHKVTLSLKVIPHLLPSYPELPNKPPVTWWDH